MKTLKKRIWVAVLSLLTFVPCTLMGQGIEIELGKEGKAIDTRSGAQRLICTDGNYYVMLEYSGIRMDKKAIVCYDKNQTETGRIDLGKDEVIQCDKGYIEGKELNLLMAEKENNSQRVYVGKYSLPTLSKTGSEKALIEQKGDNSTNFAFNTATSPDGQLLAVYSVKWTKGFAGDMRMILMNREFEEYWHKDIENISMGSMMVNDSGEVVLSHVPDEAGKECRFYVTDGEESHEYSFRLPGEDKVLESYTLRYGDGKILVATACRESGSRVFVGRNTFDRIHFFCFDLKKGSYTQNTHMINDTEYDRLHNKKPGKNKNHEVEFGVISQTFSDNTGAYIYINRSWTVSKNNMPSDFYRCGGVLIHVDTEGREIYSYTLRSEFELNPYHQRLADHRWQVTPQGVMLIVPENEKNINLNPDAKVKRFWPTRNSAHLMAICLDHQGKEVRYTVPIGKCGMAGVPYRMSDGSYVILIRGKFKGNFARLRFK